MTDKQAAQQRNNGAGMDLEALLAGTGDRVEAILEAAERAAEEILAEAESQAERYIDDVKERGDRLMHERVRRMAELSEEFLSQADRIEERSEPLLRALDEAVDSLELDVSRSVAVAHEPSPVAEREPQSPGAAAETGSETGSEDPMMALADQLLKGDRPDPAEPAALEPAEAESDDIPESVAPVNPEDHDEVAGEVTTEREIDSERARPIESIVAAFKRRGTRDEGETPSPEAEVPGDMARNEASTPVRVLADLGQAPEGSEGARLLAMQMALAGSSRDEITERLRDEFGVEDLDALVERDAGESPND